MGGKSVDAIDFYTSQINKTEAAIEGWRERIATKKPESYGFASLAAVPYAHAAAKSLRSKKPNGLKIRLAPPPNAIIWKNLTLTTGQKVRSSSIGFVLLLVILFVIEVTSILLDLINAEGLRIDGACSQIVVTELAVNFALLDTLSVDSPLVLDVLALHDIVPLLLRSLGVRLGVRPEARLAHVLREHHGDLVPDLPGLIGESIERILQLVQWLVP